MKRTEAYSDQTVLWLELLSSRKAVIDQAESSALATTEKSGESEDKYQVGVVNLVQL